MTSICQTERLIIRRYTPDDLQDAFEIYSDPEVMHWLSVPGVNSAVKSLEEMRERLEKRFIPIDATRGPQFGRFATVLKSDGRVIGTTLLKDLDGREEVEIGWHFARRAWGHGYATEAARAVMDYGFATCGLDRIVAVVAPDNARSLAVVHRLGMNHVGRTVAYSVELEYFEVRPPLSSRARARNKIRA